MSRLQEVQAYTELWAATTADIFRERMVDAKVGDTGALDASLAYDVQTAGSGLIAAQFGFLMRGRYVDMGAGRKRSATGEAMRAASAGKKRKPKRWYSRTLHGRIYRLQEVVGLRVSEAAIGIVQQVQGGVL